MNFILYTLSHLVSELARVNFILYTLSHLVSELARRRTRASEDGGSVTVRVGVDERDGLRVDSTQSENLK